ncbi:LD-carboxypeptidase [Pantoea ananatis]|uniref:LD-carboxypeptidase n=1 Tax=Pantoea ananas TaxID=553 RepID=UPI0020CA3878|nr:LD-carboxypeptidase [Pantoea ananatis]
MELLKLGELMQKISVIAPANTMKNLKKEMIEIGLTNLKSLGFKVCINEECFIDLDNIAGTTNQRATSINRAIDDEDTDIIMVVYGGYNSNDLINWIDFEKLFINNKKLIGYSDSTVLLNAYFATTGGVSFHGPGFGTFCDPEITLETKDGFLKALSLNHNLTLLCEPELSASDLWFLKEKFRPREWKPHLKWKSINKGETRGILIGGNIESFINLIGTRFCPEFEEKILLLESSFNTNPAQLRMWFSHLHLCGVFNKISGLIIGNFTECSLSKMNKDFLQKLIDEFVPCHTPVLINFSSSHTDPILTVPIGGKIHMKLSDEKNEIYMSL